MSGNLGRWSLAGGSVSVVVRWGTFEGCSQSLMFSFLSDPPCCEQLPSHPLLPLWSSASPGTQRHRTKWPWTEPLEAICKLNLPPHTHTVCPCEVFSHRNMCLNGSQEKGVRHQDLESWGCWVVSRSPEDPSARLSKQSA